jgi:hypothetical protein
MIDKRPEADRILVAQLTGEAQHRAKWRELTGDEETAAVAALRELASGRADAGSRRTPGARPAGRR